ncbi:uncharacterized protein FOMMEDRAFT_171112 [Fomitiporia mediterranea MF3/22]|uniref:uncharacterized protein n=1 Tax=Fomitiporia mediterranea (strain MF3/22) TaxID=694068 RepID=UPI0004407E45|nr:uncharacterized protein FOMMEDRAFT_171112 [Fomitiporia mediterranea MF3/22]EJC98506.1 hypothetical protein FOMMEDRAFT_171112 [Fomitiporia mediterranea MF3/22]
MNGTYSKGRYYVTADVNLLNDSLCFQLCSTTKLIKADSGLQPFKIFRMLQNDRLCDRLNNVSLVESEDSEPSISLLDLPADVMIILFDYLGVGSLRCLALTCKHLHDSVFKFGWTSYLRSNTRFSWSLSCTDRVWSAYERVRYNTITDYNWECRSFVARPLSPPWRGRQRPSLAVSQSRLVVSAGDKLDVYAFSSQACLSDAPTVHLEATLLVNRMDHHQPRHDVTSMAFLPGNGEDRRLLAGFADGSVMRVTLPDMRKSQQHPSPEFETLLVGEDPIQSISASGSLSFSLSSSGKGTLHEARGRIVSEIDIKEKCWSSFLSAGDASYVAIGTSSTVPLAIYPVNETALSSSPSVVLTSMRSSELGVRSPASAVYGIAGSPLSFPGNPGQVIVSGWFDGCVRLYDLRTPSTSSSASNSSTKAVPTLSPAMILFDPWQRESIYSVSTGGGSGYTIAAGTARHSVVAFWDVRAPRAGWSVHAPGNDTSPVYATVLESSRLFGATQSRAFVYDFGPGVGVETYPPLPRAIGKGHHSKGGVSDSLMMEDVMEEKGFTFLEHDELRIMPFCDLSVVPAEVVTFVPNANGLLLIVLDAVKHVAVSSASGQQKSERHRWTRGRRPHLRRGDIFTSVVRVDALLGHACKSVQPQSPQCISLSLPRFVVVLPQLGSRSSSQRFLPPVLELSGDNEQHVSRRFFFWDASDTLFGSYPPSERRSFAHVLSSPLQRLHLHQPDITI